MEKKKICYLVCLIFLTKDTKTDLDVSDLSFKVLLGSLLFISGSVRMIEGQGEGQMGYQLYEVGHHAHKGHLKVTREGTLS